MQLWILDFNEKHNEKAPKETVFSYNALCFWGLQFLEQGFGSYPGTFFVAVAVAVAVCRLLFLLLLLLLLLLMFGAVVTVAVAVAVDAAVAAAVALCCC